MHELPAGLPAQLYLLAYDPRKGRLVQNTGFPYLIRAAALTELLLSGRIVEEDGKPRAVPDAPPVGDPVLAGLLERIAASKPRSWQRWVHQDTRATLKAVRDELEAKRWIKVEPRRPFLIFRRTLIHVRDPRVVTRLKAKVHTALSGPLARVDDRDAALVALAAAGDHLVAVVKAGWTYELWLSADAGNSWRPVVSPTDMPADGDQRVAITGIPGGGEAPDQVLLVVDDGHTAHAYVTSVTAMS